MVTKKTFSAPMACQCTKKIIQIPFIKSCLVIPFSTFYETFKHNKEKRKKSAQHFNANFLQTMLIKEKIG